MNTPSSYTRIIDSQAANTYKYGKTQFETRSTQVHIFNTSTGWP